MVFVDITTHFSPMMINNDDDDDDADGGPRGRGGGSNMVGAHGSWVLLQKIAETAGGRSAHRSRISISLCR